MHFLFEIGVEELPASYINNAVTKLNESFTKDFAEAKIEYKFVFTYSTPRRLAIKFTGLSSSQTDETVEKVGPAKIVAYNDNGILTKAGHGFIQSIGVTEKDIYVITTPKGEYIAAKIFIKGKETINLLPNMMKNAIEKIVFPKNMKWGSGTFLFARPIRWFVAMHDSQTINFEFYGIKAGNVSYGNRYEALENKIHINEVYEYPEILKKVKVIANRYERKKMIEAGLKNFGLNEVDESLLDTVTDLVEYPTAVKADFSKEYLALPSKIITSTLTQHQKYFTITDNQGFLKNEFIFISNGDPEQSDIIKIGNEKVVKARLDDASFYYHEDIKYPLEHYVEKLNEVVFHTQLGSMLDKTNRIMNICKYLADRIIATASISLKNDFDLTEEMPLQTILRAAYLSKADLVTLMLGEKEYTSLQGYIGMRYALISGEKPEVAKAIYEHYMPRGLKDELPSEITGAVLAIADKLDTVSGIIGIGLIPTGSADPFALRRAANGVIQIIDAFGFNLSLKQITDKAFEELMISDENLLNVVKFLKQRIKWLLEETYHIDYDVIEAIDIFDWDNVIDIRNKAVALQSFKPPLKKSAEFMDNKKTEDFETLVSGFKRVSNILAKNDTKAKLNTFLLKDDKEIKLHKQLEKTKADIRPLLEKMEYVETIHRLVNLGPVIDQFFDKVMVICEDEKLKNNRLALLKEIREVFLLVADISKINIFDA